MKNTIDTPVDAPAANPIPLGSACFAIAVFLFSGYLWGSLHAESVVATALFVGGLGMLLAAVAAYRRGDTFDATWMGAYSVFWASVAFYLWFFAGRAPNSTGDLSWFSFAWGVFTAYIAVVSLRARSPLVSGQLAAFFLLFLFLWIGSTLVAAPWTNRVAAIAGIISAFVAAIESLGTAWVSTTGTAPILTRLQGTPHTPHTGVA